MKYILGFVAKPLKKQQKVLTKLKNEKATKQSLQQRKFKKCNYLNTVGNLLQNQLTFMKAMKT